MKYCSEGNILFFIVNDLLLLLIQGINFLLNPVSLSGLLFCERRQLGVPTIFSNRISGIQSSVYGNNSCFSIIFHWKGIITDFFGANAEYGGITIFLIFVTRV